MKRSYSFISILLALAIILGMQFVVSDKAYAADTEFEVKLEGDVLSWSWIPNKIGPYDLKAYAPDGSFVAEYTEYSNCRWDLNLWFDSIAGLKRGNYKLVLTASDKDGNDYGWESNYNYDKVELNPIRNYTADEKNGCLAWSHDRSTLGADVYYQVNIDVDNYSAEYEFKLTDTKLPFMDFASAGTHEYHISIRPQADGYRSGVGIEETRKLTISKGPAITGINVREDDIICWNEVEGADYYRVQCNIGYRMADYKINTPYYCPLASLRIYNSDAPMTYTYYISAYKDDKRITYGNTADYEYESREVKYYPIDINGRELDSRRTLTDLFPENEGTIAYFPADNKLVLKDFVMTDITTDWSITSPSVLFSTNEPLTIEGNGVLMNDYTAIYSRNEVIFAEGCDITILSDHTSVQADNVIVNGKLTVCCKGPGVGAKENLVISGKDAFLNISTLSTEETVKGLYSQSGNIDLGGLEITVPKGGRISDDSTTILNPDGSYAHNIMIGVPTATPKPTATPTTAPTAKPVATATSAPVAKPTATPAATATVAVKPTSQITNRPDTVPSITPDGKPAVIPTTTVPSKDPKVQILDFVNRIYEYVLGREPEEAGAAFWSDELYSFRRTGAEVGLGFIFSDEFVNRNLSDEDFVTVLYKTFFGREAEAEGFKFWTDALRSGTMSRDRVANGFIYSQEWADTCASYGIRSGGDLKPSVEITPTDATYSFVERMYTTAMNRASDEEGKKFWAGELANFRFTGEQVGAMFFLSDEMQGFGLSNEEFVTRLYKTFMDRDPEQGGFEFWVKYLNDGGSRSDVVLGFTRSEEFVNKCIEARILPY